MMGSLVNMAAIITGSLIGIVFKGGISERYNRTVMQAMGLAIILIGVKSALKSDDILIVIVGLALGSLLGEWINIEKWLSRMGHKLEYLFKGKKSNIAQGFVTTTLIYCVGSMAIIGSLESGLNGDHTTLYAKATIDGVASIVFASTMGIGVMFSALPVFLYQGALTLGASFMKPYLIASVIAQMSSIGGLLIGAIGLNMIYDRKIHVGNMLPGIFMPLIYYIIKSI